MALTGRVSSHLNSGTSRQVPAMISRATTSPRSIARLAQGPMTPQGTDGVWFCRNGVLSGVEFYSGSAPVGFKISMLTSRWPFDRGQFLWRGQQYAARMLEDPGSISPMSVQRRP